MNGISRLGRFSSCGWALGLLLLTACAGAGAAPPADGNDSETSMKLPERGQVAMTGGTLHWLELADSRCPKNVQCIVAGEAQLKMKLDRDGEEPRELLLVLAADDPRPQPRAQAQIDDHVLRLVSVEPYPDAEKPTPDGSRVATLVLEPASEVEAPEAGSQSPVQ